jgi:hypothetical protein
MESKPEPAWNNPPPVATTPNSTPSPTATPKDIKRIKALTVARVRKQEVYVDASLEPQPEKYYQALAACLPDLREFDKKRKDKGRIDRDDHCVYYQIDLEAFGYMLYCDREYPEEVAFKALDEAIKDMTSISEYEYQEKETLQRKYTGKATNLMRKYGDPAHISKVKGMFGEVGDRLADATKQMKENLTLAMQNRDKAIEIDNRTNNAKMIAQELNTDTEGLGQDESSQKRLYVLGGVAIFVVLIIIIVLIFS